MMDDLHPAIETLGPDLTYFSLILLSHICRLTYPFMASSQNNLVDISSSKRLQPGVYKITNFKSGTVVDLSAGDNKSIIGL